MRFVKKLWPVFTQSRTVSTQPQATRRIFPGPTVTFPPSSVVDEEHWAWYTPHSFYPVRIGDVLNKKYQVLYKLGFGTTATVWMCRDLCRDAYVCMKSMVCDYGSAEREIRAYKALSSAAKITDSPRDGRQYVRELLDHFEICRSERNYHFLIHEPLGVSAQLFLDLYKGRFPIYYARELALQMLHALNFVHKAGVVHADIQVKNILLRIQDKTVLKDSEEAEFNTPSLRKITDQTVVFETREMIGPLSRWIGGESLPVLCDYGEARTGQTLYTEHIQPPVYRAPEVFLHLPWDSHGDIWNYGCMIWGFIVGRHLFTRKGAVDERSADQNQLAQMTELLGPPPKELLIDAGPRALDYFDEQGKAKGAAVDETLESRLALALSEGGHGSMSDDESKMFLAFVKRTLAWKPEDRASASDLLTDPWVTYNG